MSSTKQQFRLKDSVYALEDPASGLFIRFKEPKPQLKPLHLATLAPATAHCRSELIAKGAGLPNPGVELVRVDA